MITVLYVSNTSTRLLLGPATSFSKYVRGGGGGGVVKTLFAVWRQYVEVGP